MALGDSYPSIEPNSKSKIIDVHVRSKSLAYNISHLDITITFNFDEFIRSFDLEAVFNEKRQVKEGRMEI